MTRNATLSRIALAVVVAIALVVAPTALAGKGGGKPGGGGGGKAGGGGSLSVVVLDGVDATPNRGERVTFSVSTTATDRPFVGLKCWQGSTGVYNNSMGIFPTYMFDPWLTLNSSYWSAGLEASCTARLYYYNSKGIQTDLASITFAVAP